MSLTVLTMSLIHSLATHSPSLHWCLHASNHFYLALTLSLTYLLGTLSRTLSHSLHFISFLHFPQLLSFREHHSAILIIICDAKKLAINIHFCENILFISVNVVLNFLKKKFPVSAKFPVPAGNPIPVEPWPQLLTIMDTMKEVSSKYSFSSGLVTWHFPSITEESLLTTACHAKIIRLKLELHETRILSPN